MKGKKYCGDCGTILDPTGGPLQNFLESNLQQYIQTTLKEQLKDQKVVDIETAQAVVSKLFEWPKILACLVGVPLTVLALVLGFLGINTYSDFSRTIRSKQYIAVKSLEEITQQKRIEIENISNNLMASFGSVPQLP
jgi:hypothetical protein